MPDASSWHRQLKLTTLGKRLKPDSAKDFIERFATFIMDGLQTNRRQGGQSMPKMAEAAGHLKLSVKTTTVKKLGEVLAVANFLPTTMIMSVLHDLFNASHPVDIRARVISSVLCLFDIAFDTEAIFRARASSAFIVAGPSETEPTTEIDWVNAENGGALPHISLRDDRPALDLFVKTAYYKVPKPHRAGYVQNVLLPLLDESARQHNRWMRAFLHGYDIANTCAFETFDFGPFRVNIVEDILDTWADYPPESFLPRHRDYALSYLRYAALNRLSEALAQQESGYWQTNPGKHWNEYRQACRDSQPFLNLRRVLFRIMEPAIPNGLTTESLAAEYVARAAVVARNPIKFDLEEGKFVVSTELLVGALQALRGVSSGYNETDHQKRNQVLFRRALEQIGADIESLRTEIWLNSADRQPVVLPSWLELQATTLPSPKVNPLVVKPDHEFVRRVLVLVKRCAEDRTLLTEFKWLKKLVKKCPREAEIESCALLLGDGPVDEHVTLYGALRVQLAHILVSKINSAELQLNPALKAMLAKWKASPSEYVRNAGWDLDGLYT